jgi:hypothetical protein
VPEVAREALAQNRELAVWIPVDGAYREGEGRLDVGRDILGNRVRVLVDVELDANVLLRCAIRRLAAEIVPDGKVSE